jgi:hypothetical protein
MIKTVMMVLVLLGGTAQADRKVASERRAGNGGVGGYMNVLTGPGGAGSAVNDSGGNGGLINDRTTDGGMIAGYSYNPHRLTNVDSIGNVHEFMFPIPSDVHISTNGIERLWLDANGTLHYNGSEVATKRDIQIANRDWWFRQTVSGFTGGVYGFIFSSAMLAFARRRKVRDLLMWRKLRRQRKAEGPYRGDSA